MFLYIRPYTVECPVCRQTMLRSTNEGQKYSCRTPACRMFERWFQIDLPLVTAHACSVPADTFLTEAHPQ